MVERVGDLEISQDLAWQSGTWKAQRLGWIALATFLVASVLGVFGGDGPLREASAGTGDVVEFDRFTRFGSPTELNVLPPAGSVEAGKVKVALPHDYAGDFEITSVSPQPDSVRADAGELVYTFLSGPEPDRISFAIVPRESGVQSGHVQIGELDPVEFTQVVYP